MDFFYEYYGADFRDLTDKMLFEGAEVSRGSLRLTSFVFSPESGKSMLLTDTKGLNARAFKNVTLSFAAWRITPTDDFVSTGKFNGTLTPSNFIEYGEICIDKSTEPYLEPWENEKLVLPMKNFIPSNVTPDMQLAINLDLYGFVFTKKRVQYLGRGKLLALFPFNPEISRLQGSACIIF